MTNILRDIEQICHALDNKSFIYSTFSLLAPFFMIYGIYPEDFREISFSMLILYMLFYSLMFHIIYRFYHDMKMRLAKHIQTKNLPMAIGYKYKFEGLKSDLIYLKINFAQLYCNDGTKLSIQIHTIIEDFVAKRVAKSVKMIDHIIEEINQIEPNIGNNIYERIDYKYLDHLLIFSASTIGMAIIFFDLNSTSTSFTISFVVLFFMMVVISIAYEYFKFIKLQIYVIIFKLVLPICTNFFEKRSNRMGINY